MNYAINMQRSTFYKCSSLYFDNDVSQSGFLTESQSFGANLTHYEIKSHSSEVADFERSDDIIVMSSDLSNWGGGVGGSWWRMKRDSHLCRCWRSSLVPRPHPSRAGKGVRLQYDIPLDP